VPSLTARPRFLAPGATAGSATIRLPDDEAHHLTHVLRLRPGASIAVFDGAGHEWNATVEAAGRSGVVVRLDAPVAPVPEPAVAVTLAVGVQKEMETIVREATALGVGAIIALSTSHVALPTRARRSPGNAARWTRVAVASAKQCGRATVPEVRAVASLEAVLQTWRDGPIVMCVEPGRDRSGSAAGAGPRPSRALVLVGPEGGWTDAEVARVVSAGGRLMHLGPRTLRADLAATVLLSALWTSWGW